MPASEIARILVALDREGAGEVLNKAVNLARVFQARLELFLCDAEHAYVEQHQYETSRAAMVRETCLAEARRFLESLRRASPIDGVAVAIDVACESPLYMGITAKVRRSAPDLVVRGVSGGGHRQFGPSDWDLARSCPAPLLFTRGRPWRANPVIVAAVDLSPEESPRLTRDILRTAKLFADASHGTLEVLHGEPAVVLTEFATARRYDLIVLGALTQRHTPAALVGTLTSRLIETIESDFLLLKPASSGITSTCGGIRVRLATGHAKG